MLPLVQWNFQRRLYRLHEEPFSAAAHLPSAQRLKSGWLRKRQRVFYSQALLPIQNPKRDYLITLSARTSTFGGIVRPICLAVLRLITNSNFVGCSTGKSEGLAP